MQEGYCTTLPELAKEAAKSPYGGITSRPRQLKGYLVTPDGKRYYLGGIGVSIVGYGDGLITDCTVEIKAQSFIEEVNE